MGMKLILSGEPRSTGQIYKHMCMGKFPRVYMTNDGKSLKESYGWQAKEQYRLPALTGDLEVDVRLFFGRRSKHDIDNFNKILFDALSGIVWVDDSQIIRSITEKGYDKENPRIEITVKPYEQKTNQVTVHWFLYNL